MGPSLLGIDVGTSSCKALVVTADGDEQAVGSRPTPWRLLEDGARGLDGGELIEAVLGAVADVLGARPPTEVVGAGVASMAEAGFDLGATDELTALCEALPDFSLHTGLRPSAKPVIVKHRRLRRLHPDVTRRAVRWLNVAEYVVYSLGGDQVTEPSLASRTGWLEVDRARWWPDALGWSGATAALLPELRAAGLPAGRVAGHHGIDGAVLTVAGHDHLSAAVGAGAFSPEDIVDSCGSAEAVVRTAADRPTDEERLAAAAAGFSTGWHSLPGQLAYVGGFRSGARLQELLEVLGLGSAEEADRVLPVGDGRPTWRFDDLEGLDRTICDLRVGSQPPAEAGQLWRGAVEVVALHGQGLVEELERLTGPARRIIAVGGWVRSASGLAARRRHRGPLALPSTSEAGARGAAAYAAVAAGLCEDVRVFPPAPVLEVDGTAAP
jgi:sugar (pentulose or hexulose) kinase